jgi:hypothetical protein
MEELPLHKMPSQESSLSETDPGNDVTVEDHMKHPVPQLIRSQAESLSSTMEIV